jgi:hypothetical protein
MEEPLLQELQIQEAVAAALLLDHHLKVMVVLVVQVLSLFVTLVLNVVQAEQ